MLTKNPGTDSAGGPGVRARLRHSEKALKVSRGASLSTAWFLRGSTLRVLVADDDSYTSYSLSLLVKGWGHDVWGAFGGTEAIRLAFAFQPDVILLDIAMPGMTGFEVARRLRELGRFKDTLLVAISGYADERHRNMAHASGFDQYLVKPVEPSAVEELLRLERDRLAALREQPGRHARRFAIILAEAGMD